jgi:hypothetical protein
VILLFFRGTAVTCRKKNEKNQSKTAELRKHVKLFSSRPRRVKIKSKNLG